MDYFYHSNNQSKLVIDCIKKNGQNLPVNVDLNLTAVWSAKIHCLSKCLAFSDWHTFTPRLIRPCRKRKGPRRTNEHVSELDTKIINQLQFASNKYLFIGINVILIYSFICLKQIYFPHQRYCQNIDIQLN